MNNNQPMVIYRGTIAGKEKTITVAQQFHKNIVVGEAALERKLIPYNRVESVVLELYKFPFRKPIIRETKTKIPGLFSKVRRKYYYLTEGGFFQAHDASDLVIVDTQDLVRSKTEAFTLAQEELSALYYGEEELSDPN